ncbi:MAG: hypothetical protein MN733_37385, partial [Nitrososphaera sp.]|nr:hypothetical protein [Nitrososphaera sp.]
VRLGDHHISDAEHLVQGPARAHIKCKVIDEASEDVVAPKPRAPSPPHPDIVNCFKTWKVCLAVTG